MGFFVGIAVLIIQKSKKHPHEIVRAYVAPATADQGTVGVAPAGLTGTFRSGESACRSAPFPRTLDQRSMKDISQKRTMLAENVRNLIIQMIHDSMELPAINYSTAQINSFRSKHFFAAKPIR